MLANDLSKQFPFMLQPNMTEDFQFDVVSIENKSKTRNFFRVAKQFTNIFV